MFKNLNQKRHSPPIYGFRQCANSVCKCGWFNPWCAAAAAKNEGGGPGRLGNGFAIILLSRPGFASPFVGALQFIDIGLLLLLFWWCPPCCCTQLSLILLLLLLLTPFVVGDKWLCWLLLLLLLCGWCWWWLPINAFELTKWFCCIKFCCI